MLNPKEFSSSRQQIVVNQNNKTIELVNHQGNTYQDLATEKDLNKKKYTKKQN